MYTNLPVSFSIKEANDRYTYKNKKDLKRTIGFKPSRSDLYCDLLRVSDDFLLNITCDSSDKKYKTALKHMKLLPLSKCYHDSIESWEFLYDSEIIKSKKLSYFEYEAAFIEVINGHKKEYQDECQPNSSIYLDSNIHLNGYRFVWRTNERLNIMIYDVG